MIASLDAPDSPPTSSARSRQVLELATLLGWIVLAAAIGYSYLGHSSSPYGVCYVHSGRSVPCAALARR
jgi:hypothetical protein